MSRHNSKQISDVKVMLLQGEKGTSIASVEKAFSEGLVDTYTITMNDGTKYSFTVTNGNSISTIQKTSTSGLVDTYTITFEDGSTQTFTVTNGNGITSVEKTDTSGLVDTYTITFDDGTTETFTVTNGENGHDASSENFATIEETSTASKAYVTGEHLVFNGLYYKVTRPIAQGGTLSIGTNLTRVLVGDEITDIAEEQFKNLYDLISRTTTMTKNSSGNITQIVESSSDATVTTTFSTSGNTKTITTTIVPTSGDYNYTRTSVVVSSSNRVTVTDSYTKTAKGA